MHIHATERRMNFKSLDSVTGLDYWRYIALPRPPERTATLPTSPHVRVVTNIQVCTQQSRQEAACERASHLQTFTHMTIDGDDRLQIAERLGGMANAHNLEDLTEGSLLAKQNLSPTMFSKLLRQSKGHYKGNVFFNILVDIYTSKYIDKSDLCTLDHMQYEADIYVRYANPFGRVGFGFMNKCPRGDHVKHVWPYLVDDGVFDPKSKATNFPMFPKTVEWFHPDEKKRPPGNTTAVFVLPVVYSGQSRNTTRSQLEKGYLKDVLRADCLEPDHVAIISDSMDMEHPFTPSALPEDLLVEYTSSGGSSAMEGTDAAPKKDPSKGADSSDAYQSVMDLLHSDSELTSQVLSTYDFAQYIQWCLYGFLGLLTSHLIVRYCLHIGFKIKSTKGKVKVKRPPPPSMLRSLCHIYVTSTGHLLWSAVYLWQSVVWCMMRFGQFLCWGRRVLTRLVVWCKRVSAQAVVVSISQVLASVTWFVRQLSSAVVWSREMWKSLCGILRGFWESKRGSGERNSSSRASMDAKTSASSIAVGSSSSCNKSASTIAPVLDSSIAEAVEASDRAAAAAERFISGESAASVPGSTEGCNGAVAAAGDGGTGSTTIASDDLQAVHHGIGTTSSSSGGRSSGDGGSSSSGGGGNSSSGSHGNSSSGSSDGGSCSSSSSSSSGFCKMTSQPSGSSGGHFPASDTNLVTDQNVRQGREKGSSWAGGAGASVSSNCATTSSSSGAPCQPDVTSAGAVAAGTGLKKKKQQKQQQQQGVVVPAGTRGTSTTSSSSVGVDGSRALGCNTVGAPVDAKGTSLVAASRPRLTAAAAVAAGTQSGIGILSGAAKLDAKAAAGCQPRPTAANQQVLAGSKGLEQPAGVVAVNYKQAVKAQQQL